MLKRVLTALVGIPILVAVISYAPPAGFAAVVAVLAALGCREAMAMAAQRELAALPRFATVAAALVAVSPWLGQRWPLLRPEAAIAACVLLGSCLAMRLVPVDRVFEALATSLCAVVWVGLLASYLMALRMISGAALYAVLIVVWGADAGAYAAGRLFGRHKLAPEISPNKTIEGVVGGVLFAVLGLALAQRFLDLGPPAGPRHVIALGSVLALVSVVGDLAESAVKRGAGVKDSGRIFPGHGGVLDRVDSLLFAGPVMYYWLL